MTDLDTGADAPDRRATPRPSRAELDALRVPELRALATSLGVPSVSSLRKGSLVDAISDITTAPTDTEAGAAPGDDAPDGATTSLEPGAEEGRTEHENDVDEQAGGAGDEPEGLAEEQAPPAELDAAAAEESTPLPTPSEPSPLPPSEPSPLPPSEPLPLSELEEPEAVAPGADADEAPVGEVPAGVDAPAVVEDEPTAPLDSAADAAPAVETAEARRDTPAPKPAVDHTNAGLTGIAEDLEQLSRREAGETPAVPTRTAATSLRDASEPAGVGPGQHDGTHPVENAETAEGAEAAPVEQPEARGRRRGRGRGGDRQQGDRQQQNGQQQGQQQNGQQAQQQQAEPEPAEEAPRQGQQQGQPQDRQGDGQQEGRGRGRYRDRRRRGQGTDADEPEINDDDVLIPIAGILDVLDNYAFVRTSGYLAGTNDVYVSLGQVKKYALRRGDAVVGAVKQPRDAEGAGRQKYNAIVRIDSINGLPVAEAENRVDFAKLTPLYPQERLRLETDPQKLTGRVIDLVSPIGKGQRGLIVSPPKAGKTLVLQAVANAVTRNNPEVHLMVVLVDERPEEVTEMQRTVKGEVIASTFDRPAEDHTTVAELAIERAQRLVELGYDVVVLLDSITRLGRAYNQVVPPSGRVLPGGVDAAALHPAKRFFGAARNIENGGSLTILATALVETGSKTDEVILEEFTGTDNMELRLSGALADQRIFPAVDVTASGTRREELLMGPDEVRVTATLRRALAGLESQAALEVVLATMRETTTNVEFLVQMQKTLPGGAGARRE